MWSRVLCALLLVSGQAALIEAAVTLETGPGCGLGAILWSDSAAKKHIMQQSMIATTNGIGSQTLAISSGTSGCTNDGQIVRKEKINVYASVNYESLLQDMAQGGGEHLASLAHLLGLPHDQQAAFFALTQARYDRLVPAQPLTPESMLAVLEEEMNAAAPPLRPVSR